MNYKTAVAQQYINIKSRYPDAIILMRADESVITFDDDAEALGKHFKSLVEPEKSKILQKEAKEAFTAVDNILKVLVKAGFKVAICEPLPAKE